MDVLRHFFNSNSRWHVRRSILDETIFARAQVPLDFPG
jgi:hypothetical protein